MKIIIPMAGHSRRFKEKGYAVLKPFINIDGKTMIERVCQMFSPNDEFIFVCNKEHLINKDYRKILESVRQFYHIVEIAPHELGPVYSALKAEAVIKSQDEPIIISYCDFTMEWNYKRFLLKAAQYDGGIPAFRGMHPASLGKTYYAYMRANENLEMLKLREKQSFTSDRKNEFASTGVYYIDSWKTFYKYGTQLLENKEKIASEYYCSLIYNLMIRDGMRVCLFEVDKFICWGTPEDLEEYMFWSQYFNNHTRQISK